MKILNKNKIAKTNSKIKAKKYQDPAILSYSKEFHAYLSIGLKTRSTI